MRGIVRNAYMILVWESEEKVYSGDEVFNGKLILKCILMFFSVFT
jgi:hypothetical protein